MKDKEGIRNIKIWKRWLKTENGLRSVVYDTYSASVRLSRLASPFDLFEPQWLSVGLFLRMETRFRGTLKLWESRAPTPRWFFVERIEGISLIGLPKVELFPDPEDDVTFSCGGLLLLDCAFPELEEVFVSQDDAELLGEFKEFMDVWLEGGGGAWEKKYSIYLEFGR